MKEFFYTFLSFHFVCLFVCKQAEIHLMLDVFRIYEKKKTLGLMLLVCKWMDMCNLCKSKHIFNVNYFPELRKR